MAYQFDGAAKTLSVAASSIFQLNTAFTFSCFCNPSSLTGFNIVSAYYGNTTGATSTGWILLFSGSSLRFDWQSSSGFASTSGGTATLNANQLISLTYNGTNVKGRIGTTQAFDTAVSVQSYVSPLFTLGSYYYAGTLQSSMNGSIAEPAIWNVALTDAEIASLAAGFTPDQIRPQSLQFYAPLVRDLVDARGGRTITNVNSATVATHPRIIT